jgi:hypothetical protein
MMVFSSMLGVSFVQIEEYWNRKRVSTGIGKRFQMQEMNLFRETACGRCG